MTTTRPRADPADASEPRFDGFPPEAIPFFAGLGADNSKAYWTAHREMFERAVARPVQALAAELQPRFGSLKVFRPYRDVRFTNDKRPYQEHTSIATPLLGVGGLYFRLDARETLAAGGIWSPGSGALRRFREAVDDPAAASSFDRMRAGLEAAGFELDGMELATAPRGWPRDHPRIDLLRLRNLEIGRRRAVGPWVHDRRLLDEVSDAWERLAAWNGRLAEHDVVDA